MTTKEAILTLNANVVIACKRAEFSSATVKMVEDALNTIEDALKAQEPRVIELDEFENVLGRDVPLYFEQRDSISGWDIFSGLEKGTMDIITSAQWAEDQTWQREFYGKEWRCWTSRPTKEQMEAEEWE